MVDAISVLAITALVVAIPSLYRERLAPIKHLFRRHPVLRDAAWGLSELRLPSGWRAAQTLNDGAGIEAIDPLRGRYAIVISEWREDFDASLTLEEYSQSTRADLTSDVVLVSASGPEARRVGGHQAIQFEIDGVHEQTAVKYLHTVVLGRRAFHQVIAWAPRKRYSRPVFDRLLDGFTETPGEDAQPRSHIAERSKRRIGF